MVSFTAEDVSLIPAHLLQGVLDVIMFVIEDSHMPFNTEASAKTSTETDIETTTSFNKQFINISPETKSNTNPYKQHIIEIIENVDLTRKGMGKIIKR